MNIPMLSTETDSAELAQALDEAGCLVVTGATTPAQREAVKRELDPHLSAARVIDDDDPAQFYPGRTRRTSALVARSPTVGGWV